MLQKERQRTTVPNFPDQSTGAPAGPAAQVGVCGPTRVSVHCGTKEGQRTNRAVLSWRRTGAPAGLAAQVVVLIPRDAAGRLGPVITAVPGKGSGRTGPYFPDRRTGAPAGPTAQVVVLIPRGVAGRIRSVFTAVPILPRRGNRRTGPYLLDLGWVIQPDSPRKLWCHNFPAARRADLDQCSLSYQRKAVDKEGPYFLANAQRH